MNQNTLYLHIGTHKTGSTTIQNILEKENKKLIDEGIYYLGRFRGLSKPMKSMTKYDKNHVLKFRNEARQLIKDGEKHKPHTFVASNEKWSGHDMMAYGNASVNAKMLYDIFEPFKFEIKIVVYLRRQDKFFESAYAQKIKQGAAFTFSDYLEKINYKNLHWDSFLSSYANIFGKDNIIIKRFDKEYLPTPNSLIQRFGKVISSDYLTGYVSNDVKNRGYSKDVVEFARISNKYMTKNERRNLKHLLIDANFPKKNCSYFTLSEKKDLLSHFEESNRNTAITYLQDDATILFSRNDLMNGHSNGIFNGLKSEDIAVILLKTMFVQNQKLLSKIEKNSKMQFHNSMKRKIKKFLNYFKSKI